MDELGHKHGHSVQVDVKGDDEVTITNDNIVGNEKDKSTYPQQ